jgi:hypothetical protein
VHPVVDDECGFGTSTGALCACACYVCMLSTDGTRECPLLRCCCCPSGSGGCSSSVPCVGSLCTERCVCKIVVGVQVRAQPHIVANNHLQCTLACCSALALNAAPLGPQQGRQERQVCRACGGLLRNHRCPYTSAVVWCCGVSRVRTAHIHNDRSRTCVWRVLVPLCDSRNDCIRRHSRWLICRLY